MKEEHSDTLTNNRKYDNSAKIKLVELINSCHFPSGVDLLKIATQLFMLGKETNDFELLSDAFIIISYNNLINNQIDESNNLIVSIGECLLSNISNYRSDDHNLVFLEFISRRISSSNINNNNETLKSMIRIFYSIHRENIKRQLREPLFKENDIFMEDFLLDTTTYEYDINHFVKSNNPLYLYKALNSIYYNECNILNKTFKLSEIHQIILSQNYRMDDLEYCILLYNCIHNYHILFNSIQNVKQFDLVYMKGYFEAIKKFLFFYFEKLNFKPKLIIDFKVKIYPLLISKIKKNLINILEKIKSIELSECELNDNSQTNCCNYIEECLDELELKWKNQSDRLLFYRDYHKIEEDVVFALLCFERSAGVPLEFEPCSDDGNEIFYS